MQFKTEILSVIVCKPFILLSLWLISILHYCLRPKNDCIIANEYVPIYILAWN